MHIAPSHVLAVVLAVLGLLGAACTDDGEVGGPAVGGSAAVSVGDAQLSHSDLADLVDDWAANPDFLATAVGVTDLGEPGRRPAALVNFVLNFWAQSEQARQSESALETPSDDASTVITGLSQQYPAFAQYDESFQTVIADALSAQNGLIGALNQGLPVEVPPVEVSSRYGDAVDTGVGVFTIEPPAGPQVVSDDPFGV